MATDINFVETDSAKIYNALIGNLMDYCNEPLYPGDERRIFGEGLVQVFVALFNEFNDKSKQRVLRFARGEVLDAIGEMYGTDRAEPAAASAVFRFSVAAPIAENIIIPAGTRITSDGSVYFATQETAVLSAGSEYVDILGVCLEGGSDYNGFTAGTLATLVDLIPYIAAVSNITISTGGDNGEPYTEEGDERYRSRIHLAFSQLSTAGPETAYKYFAMAADPDIVDISVDVPSACTVVLYPLMVGGELPDEETRAKILAAVNGDKVRPMTDLVSVEQPQTVDYNIEIVYYCKQDNEAATIQAIEGEGGAIERYNEWQTAELARDINPDQLRRFILAPNWAADLVGAERVDVISPTFAKVGKSQVARLSGNIIVSHVVI